MKKKKEVEARKVNNFRISAQFLEYRCHQWIQANLCPLPSPPVSRLSVLVSIRVGGRSPRFAAKYLPGSVHRRKLSLELNSNRCLRVPPFPPRVDPHCQCRIPPGQRTTSDFLVRAQTARLVTLHHVNRSIPLITFYYANANSSFQRIQTVFFECTKSANTFSRISILRYIYIYI